MTVPFALCCAAQPSPAIHPVPPEKNIDGAYCIQRSAVNPDVMFEGNPFIGPRNLKA